MFYFIFYVKSKYLGDKCALLIDGCFSGGISGLFIGYVFFEVVEGGVIVFLEEGDIICIDILNWMIDVLFSDEMFVEWCRRMEV